MRIHRPNVYGAFYKVTNLPNDDTSLNETIDELCDRYEAMISHTAVSSYGCDELQVTILGWSGTGNSSYLKAAVCVANVEDRIDMIDGDALDYLLKNSAIEFAKGKTAEQRATWEVFPYYAKTYYNMIK